MEEEKNEQTKGGGLNQESYVTILPFMVEELGLSGASLIIYAVIYGYSKDGCGMYWGGLSYLAKWSNTTVQCVIKCLKKLEENGLILKRKDMNQHNLYMVLRKPAPKTPTPTLKKETQKSEIAKEPEVKAEKAEAKKAEPKEKVPLLEREPKNDIEKVEKEYLQNYADLYKNGVVKCEQPIINWGASRKLTKDVLKKYGLEKIIEAVQKSKGNDFCIKKGYALSTILSSGVLSELINGTDKLPQRSKKQSFVDQLGVDDVRNIENIPF